jgi:phage tail sheath gpL-like
VPLFYVEFDNSMANTATATQRTLLIGQMLASGSAQEKIPVKFPLLMQWVNSPEKARCCMA